MTSGKTESIFSFNDKHVKNTLTIISTFNELGTQNSRAGAGLV